ncbi:MAG: 50S ribosomal protein L22 [Candidatus Diapherotrites archaeon]|nr:50S ribosomal protein L22 [Candidatus Diapherotrites archaeon]
MSKKNYNVQFSLGTEKTIAKAIANNAPVSLKYSTEISREIKGKRVAWAIQFLKAVAEKTRHLPLRRYNKEVPHRKGDAISHTKTGRYPKRCATKWVELLEQLKANADYKGLNAENLIIIHAFASKGVGRTSHQKQGKISGKTHVKKAAHLEVIARENAA